MTVNSTPRSTTNWRLRPASPGRADYERVRNLTRSRFAIAAADTVMVSEISCTLPGCPPLETHVAFWSERGRHHFMVFKPVSEVADGDLPPAFMKNALLAADGAVECC